MSQEQTSRAAADAEISQAIETLDDRVDSVENSVSGVQSDLTTVQSGLTSVQNNVSTLQSNLATAMGNISSTQNGLATAQSNISDIQNDITEAQDDITNVKSGLSTVQSNLATVQGNISNMQTSIASKADAQEVATALESKANSVDVESALAGKVGTVEMTEALTSKASVESVGVLEEEIGTAEVVSFDNSFHKVGYNTHRSIDTSWDANHENVTVTAMSGGSHVVFYRKANGHKKFRVTIKSPSERSFYIGESNTKITEANDTFNILKSKTGKNTVFDGEVIEITKEYLVIYLRAEPPSGMAIILEQMYPAINALNGDYTFYAIPMKDLGGVRGRYNIETGEYEYYKGEYYYKEIDVTGIDYIAVREGTSTSTNLYNNGAAFVDANGDIIEIAGQVGFTLAEAYTERHIRKVPATAKVLRIADYMNNAFSFYAKTRRDFLHLATCSGTQPSGETALNILHYTDIHGDQTSSETINSAICELGLLVPFEVVTTGDVVTYYADGGTYDGVDYPNGTDWWKSQEISKKSLFVLGNHDNCTKNATEYDNQEDSAAWNGKGKSFGFNSYFSEHLSALGYDLPTGYDDPNSEYYQSCFWKKDYSEPKIRLIGLDCVNRFDGICDPTTGEITTAGLKYLTNEQERWLIARLNETLDSNNAAYGYSVIIVGHYPLDDVSGLNNSANTNGGIVYSGRSNDGCLFHNYAVQTGTLNKKFTWRNHVANSETSTTKPHYNKGTVNNIGNIVEAWRTNGGKFIMFLCGHTHDDYFFYPNDFPNLLTMCTNQAGYLRGSSHIRIKNQDNYAFFTFFSVNTTKGHIKIVRHGYTTNYRLQKAETLVYDYVNRKVIQEQ